MEVGKFKGVSNPRPRPYDPTTLRPYDPEIAHMLFFALHKTLQNVSWIIIHIHFARPFARAESWDY